MTLDKQTKKHLDGFNPIWYVFLIFCLYRLVQIAFAINNIVQAQQQQQPIKMIVIVFGMILYTSNLNWPKSINIQMIFMKIRETCVVLCDHWSVKYQSVTQDSNKYIYRNQSTILIALTGLNQFFIIIFVSLFFSILFLISNIKCSCSFFDSPFIFQ